MIYFFYLILESKFIRIIIYIFSDYIFTFSVDEDYYKMVEKGIKKGRQEGIQIGMQVGKAEKRKIITRQMLIEGSALIKRRKLTI